MLVFYIFTSEFSILFFLFCFNFYFEFEVVLFFDLLPEDFLFYEFDYFLLSNDIEED